MTDTPYEDEPYERWLVECREVTPPATLAVQIMCQVAELDRQRQDIWWLRLFQRIEYSRAARWAVCGGALAVGGLPFVILAHVAQFVTF
ncbi:hypothetical protein [Bythopirellula goksoeyrii]|uniref:Uncharacterized protein n=1 Tax=Bythopirellula goksoeyrii TaxID=1400387 RepID=A0A5B9QUM2_9BACT|nr:hypothetical protein [Bythopirellula goksoeyrii]QEG37613.1 hypothetical protein Pr1d_49590 [Bythopirellula goksoeyrii]